MKALVERIQNEGCYIGNGIIKVDGFLNHQIDPELTHGMGQEFARLFSDAGVTGVTRVVTAEVSGIAPAMATAAALKVPMVFARKHRPITMTSGFYLVEAPSRTKKNMVQLAVSKDYLKSEDRVVLIDDFLATGKTLDAMVRLIRESGATLLGIGCVIEKCFENGRDMVKDLDIPCFSLAKIDLKGDDFSVSD